jgi:hypothetical protein
VERKVNIKIAKSYNVRHLAGCKQFAPGDLIEFRHPYGDLNNKITDAGVVIQRDSRKQTMLVLRS